MELPLVSIIIPCYNQGKYLDEAIKSVLSSSYKEYEIIVINDGSTDPYTNQILENSNWDKTKIVHTKNQGLAEARNTGIKASKGSYILPLDADDKITPFYIEKAVEILKSNKKVKIVYCDIEYFGRKFGKMVIPEYSLERLMGRNFIVCSSFFRREDYDKTYGYNSNMKYGFEDWDFWLSLLEDGGEVHHIPEVHFFYRMKKRSMIKDLLVDEAKLAILRKQIYLNHKNLYSSNFFNPIESFEYILLKRSLQYRIGNLFYNFLKLFF